MKIIATADLHGDLPDPRILPKADVLVIAGDVLPDDYHFPYRDVIGSTRVQRQGWWFEHVFIPWLTEVKSIKPDNLEGVWEKRYKSIIFTPGNHDFFFQAMLPDGIRKRLPNNVFYLSESSETIDGIKFFGAGWNCTRGWAFCLDEESHIERLQNVPKDVDVMIIHGPPYVAAIDELHVHYMSPALGLWVGRQLNLKAFICGHIHEAYGQYQVGSTPVHVVSRKDRNYKDVNKFVEIDI